jgi:ribosome-associated heat shock protein Hsp15
MPVKEKLRLDKYLWAIRLFKTRTLAAAACDTNKVKYNGSAVKASKNVNIGDEYEVKTEVKRWRIKVTGLLQKRVAASEAIKHYIDITPQEEIQRLQFQLPVSIPANVKARSAVPPKKKEETLMIFGRIDHT